MWRWLLLTHGKHMNDLVISLRGSGCWWLGKLSYFFFVFFIIEVFFQSQESERSCICVFGVSMLPLSVILIFYFVIVLTVWYFLLFVILLFLVVIVLFVLLQLTAFYYHFVILSWVFFNKDFVNTLIYFLIFCWAFASTINNLLSV